MRAINFVRHHSLVSKATYRSVTTYFFSHPLCEAHHIPDHPESPGRLRSIEAAMSTKEFAALQRKLPNMARRDQLLLAHTQAHVDHVLALCGDADESGDMQHVDMDTCIGPGSGTAALLAAGAVCDAIDAVAQGDAVNAFVAVRPPGHHAEADRAMGFCLFNNVAVGALHALSKWSAKAPRIERVAIVDIDVHHGNGTQDIAWKRRDLFFASTHQGRFYPGTGHTSERGEWQNILNVPLASGCASTEWRKAYRDRVLPAVESYAPDLLLVSAGFDAHARDPLAQLELQSEDFAWVAQELKRVATRVCCGRMVCVLEGGYHEEALAASVAAMVREMMVPVFHSPC